MLDIEKCLQSGNFFTKAASSLPLVTVICFVKLPPFLICTALFIQLEQCNQLLGVHLLILRLGFDDGRPTFAA